MDAAQKPWHRPVFIAGAAGAAAFLLLPWWRNHAILRDFYDYGLVVAAAFRLSLGEHPYVDFLTPIQTLQFLLARLAEWVCGPRYLSLTYANAVFIAGGFFGLTALLVRPLGRVAAIMVAAAVIAASAGQHTIVWHNALGVTWVAVAVWLGARLESEVGPGSLRRLVLVWAILWLGGMTKLTYQVTALAFVSLFALAHGWLRLRSWRWVGLRLGGCLLFGVLAPVVTELLYTGATFGQWWHNVVVMPGARMGLLTEMARVRFYLHTPHDYYKPLYFPFVGAWGLLLLLVLGALHCRWTRLAPLRARVRIFGGVALAGAAICGGVLLATNYDISYLAGAAWLVLGTGVALATMTDEGGRLARPAVLVLSVAAASLLAPAWPAAWSGTRALWGTSPLVRSELVSSDGLPKRYAYFQGMRIPRSLRMTMEAFAVEQDELAKQGVPPSAYYFANATEWMVRAVPEARHHGLPLWLQDGTTYGEPEARLIEHRLVAGNEIQAVVSYVGWDIWFEGIDWYLGKRYRRLLVGPRFELFLRRSEQPFDWRDPVSFSLATDSTAFAKDLTATGSPLALCLRPQGNFVGAEGPVTIGVKEPLTRLRGELVVRRTAPGNGRSRVDLRLVDSIGANAHREILRNWRIELARDEEAKTLWFDEKLAGQRVALEIDLPSGADLEAGIRKLTTDYSPEVAEAGPPRMDGSLTDHPGSRPWAGALFALDDLKTTPVFVAAPAVGADHTPSGPELMAHTPSEVWFPIDPRLARLSGEFGLKPVAWTSPTALPGVAARVVYYRPGHLQILFEREIRPLSVPADRPPQAFDVVLPGKPGWIGLLFTSLNPPVNAYGQSWWRRVRAR